MRLQKLYNPIVAGVLRSPLDGMMSKSVMLLTYRDRRSGWIFTTPISYVKDSKEFLAVASREHAWWKNLRGRQCAGEGTCSQAGAKGHEVISILLWLTFIDATLVDVYGTSISFLARLTLAIRIWPTVRSPTG